MEDTLTAPTCANHPDRPTLLSCTRCERPMCPDCAVNAAVGLQCVNCVQAAGRQRTDPTAKQARAGARRLARRENHASAFRPGLAFFVLLGLFLAVCVAAAFAEFTGEVTGYLRLLGFSIIFLGAVLSVTIHEYAHAIVAYHAGDWTVVEKGYLTLDPRKYTHPLLSIGFPIMALLLGGLPLPGGAVWLDEERIRGRWWRTAVSLAGPASNLVFALVLVAVVKTGVLDGAPVLASSLLFLAFIEFAIVVLNLLPIPGLDGYHAIEAHLPDHVRHALLPLQQFGLVILMVLVFSTSALGFIWDIALWGMETLAVPLDQLALGIDLGNPQIFTSSDY